LVWDARHCRYVFLCFICTAGLLDGVFAVEYSREKEEFSAREKITVGLFIFFGVLVDRILPTRKLDLFELLSATDRRG
jgi:predicted metal-binding transcription factor (methanogenesis marker protein 9)